MAIEAFGLSTTSTGTATNSIKIVYGGGTPSGVWLRWHTMQGAGVIKAFDLAVSVRRVLKSNGTNANGGGGVSDTQYGDWSDWYYEQVPIAQCSPMQDATGYNYSHTLNLSGMYAKEGLADGFAFTTRKNDEMDFQLKIKAIYETAWATSWNEGVTVSPVTYSEAWIGWIPQYSINSASFDSTGDLTVRLSRPYWARVDDEWVLTKVVNGGSVVTGKKHASGKVGQGSITIPRRAFTRALKAGSTQFWFTINAAYKSKGYALTSISGGTANVADLSVSATPSVVVTPGKKSVDVRVSKGSDQAVASTKFDIVLRGGDDSTDSLTDVFAGTHTIPYPPLDKPFYIDVRGHGSNAQSKIVSMGPYIIKGDKLGTLIEDVKDASRSACIYYGTISKRSGGRDVEVVKLAGRERSSAYFGTGATVSEMIQGKLIDVDGIEKGEADALEELCTDGGVVMVRKPGGYRHRCVVTKFTAQRGCVSPVVEVQVSLTEVG